MARFALVPLLCAQAVLGHVLSRRLAVDFVNPATGGGSWLDNAGNSLGEPLNVVISGLSSPDVLTDKGFLNFARSLGLSTECLGLHIGGPQSANLGDGNGPVNQAVELREDFKSILFGTCLESAAGGNHFRMFRQNGPNANTGALFLAVSEEEDLSHQHTISPNGYDTGRDKLVASAVGTTHFGGVTYSTTEKDFTGFIQPGSAGINHGIATDGVVKLLTVTIR
ncbi:hypothetical protein BJV78DRAFT_1273107 [Lactifluus subvellereus]|nr:hypothetical protein BJV78DRAFT_1273107 [Lactifluus subvellereus]